MNALVLLKQDHGNVDNLFRDYESAPVTDHAGRRRTVDHIIEQLSVHAAIEEQLFYPAVRAAVAGAEDVTLESLEEHHIVKWVLSELEKLSPAEERFHAKVTVLIENVRHHVQEEEDDLFPKVRDTMSVQELEELGEAMEAAKKTAPTRPHPRQPDTPPANVVLGMPIAILDRAIEAGRETVSRLLRHD